MVKQLNIVCTFTRCRGQGRIGAGVVPLRGVARAALCRTQLVPEIFKSPTTGQGWVVPWGKACFRRGKNTRQRKKERKKGRNSRGNNEVSEGVRGGALGARVEDPLQPVEVWPVAMLEQVFPSIHGKDGYFLKELQAVERTHAGAGEKHEKEGAKERSCYGMTTTPQSPSPCISWGGGIKRIWKRSEENGKEGWKDILLLLMPYYILISDKLN